MGTEFALALAWISVAMLAAGFAGERGRSRWNWFWICLLLGPIGVFILISWPRREDAASRPDRDTETRRESDDSLRN